MLSYLPSADGVGDRSSKAFVRPRQKSVQDMFANARDEKRTDDAHANGTRLLHARECLHLQILPAEIFENNCTLSSFEGNAMFMNFVCQNELFSELSSQHTLLATSIIVTFIFLRYTHKAIKRCVSNVDTCAKLPLTSKSTNKRTRSTLNSRATSAPGESFILYLVLFNHLSFSTSHWI